MPFEKAAGARNIRPLSKPFTPPLIVFWRRVKLWKIKCDYSRLLPFFGGVIITSF